MNATTTEQQHTEMSVCRDCVMMLANGETDPEWTDEQRAEFLARFEAGHEGLERVTLGSIECEYCGRDARQAARDAGKDDVENCEPWFSHSSCDLCGSPLGGHRDHAVGWFPRTDAPQSSTAGG